MKTPFDLQLFSEALSNDQTAQNQQKTEDAVSNDGHSAEEKRYTDANVDRIIDLKFAQWQKFLSSGTTGTYVLVDSTDTTSTNYAPLNNGTTTSAGSGTAHNNMPPYLAVYVWKRTA